MSGEVVSTAGRPPVVRRYLTVVTALLSMVGPFTIDTYLPLLVALGTATDDEPIRPLYEGWEYGSLALHSYTVSCPDADNTPGT